MAEHVTQYQVTSRNADLGRLREFAARLNPGGGSYGGQLRTHDSRDALGMFDWFVAAKGREPIRAVRYHVCRHDEGIGNCSSSTFTVG